MSQLNFIHDLKVQLALAAAAAGTTSLTTAVIDTQGFESVAFIAQLGDVTDTSALTLTMQHGDESDGSDMADLALTATHTADATDADDKIMMVDAHRPQKRYVRATLDRATANAVLNSIIAVSYNANECPVTQHADVIASTHVNDPQAA